MLVTGDAWRRMAGANAGAKAGAKAGSKADTTQTFQQAARLTKTAYAEHTCKAQSIVRQIMSKPEWAWANNIAVLKPLQDAQQAVERVVSENDTFHMFITTDAKKAAAGYKDMASYEVDMRAMSEKLDPCLTQLKKHIAMVIAKQEVHMKFIDT